MKRSVIRILLRITGSEKGGRLSLRENRHLELQNVLN